MSNSKDFLRKFLPYYKPFKGTLFLDLMCALLFALSGLTFPILVRYLLNNCLSDSVVMLKPILIVAGLMLLMRIVEMFCKYFMTTVGHVMGAKLEANMRRDLYDKLLLLPNSFYDNNKVGDLMSRVNHDLFEITEFSHHCPEELFIAAVKLIGIFVYLSFVNLWLTLIIFATLPLIALFAVFNNRRMHSTFMRQRRAVGEINSHLEDSLSGISVVKSFANENVERDRFQDGNNKFVSIKRKSYKIMGFFHSGITLCSGLLYVLTVILGAIFINMGSLSTVDMVTYLLYISTLLATVETITVYTEQFQNGATGFKRFMEIMETPVEITDGEFDGNIDFKSDIQFRNVTFAYGSRGKEVLNNFNLTVNYGDNIALVGPSGGGKTTIANLLPRFYDVLSGDVLVGGVSVKSLPLKVLRDNVGVVQQNVYLFDGSVKDNILYGKPNATMDEVIEAATNAGAHDFITKLEDGYDTHCGERGVKLSGGQKQRISIARLFLKNPPILVLDEATSALDNESEQIVQQSLNRLAKGRTTITIAHRLSTIRKASRIIVVDNEGIAEEGNHEQLINKRGLYYKLYNLSKSEEQA